MSKLLRLNVLDPNVIQTEWSTNAKLLRKAIERKTPAQASMTYHLNLLSGLPEGAPQASIIMIMMSEDDIQTISKKRQGFVLESLRLHMTRLFSWL